MRPEDRDKAYLWDMLDAALAIDEFVGGKTIEDYRTNRMLRAAVERQVEIIGEAARRISESTRHAHPEVPWRGIVGQRNVLAHEYDAVLDEAIWSIASKRIPELIRTLSAFVPLALDAEVPPPNPGPSLS